MTDPRKIPDLPVTVGKGLDCSRTVSHSQATLTQLMSPQDANLWGNVFGGVILALVDKVAWVSAARHCENPCVTASFDQVDFRSPIDIGEVVTLSASINTVGRTSMEIGVRVEAESVHGAIRRHTNSCYVTMVAIDEDMKPIPVPRLELESEEHYRRHQDAEARRKARLKLAEQRRARRAGDG
ncbi:MAG: acyl-CoA thioesterase [Gemmatimonadota bacterium]